MPPENWTGALEWLPRWESVSPAARAAWLTLKPPPGAGALPARVADELVRAGLVDPPGPTGTQFKVVQHAKPLLRALRAMPARLVVSFRRAAEADAYLAHAGGTLLPQGEGTSPATLVVAVASHGPWPPHRAWEQIMPTQPAP